MGSTAQLYFSQLLFLRTTFCTPSTSSSIEDLPSGWSIQHFLGIVSPSSTRSVEIFLSFVLRPHVPKMSGGRIEQSPANAKPKNPMGRNRRKFPVATEEEWMNPYLDRSRWGPPPPDYHRLAAQGAFFSAFSTIEKKAFSTDLVNSGRKPLAPRPRPNFSFSSGHLSRIPQSRFFRYRSTLLSWLPCSAKFFFK